MGAKPTFLALGPTGTCHEPEICAPEPHTGADADSGAVGHIPHERGVINQSLYPDVIVREGYAIGSIEDSAPMTAFAKCAKSWELWFSVNALVRPPVYETKMALLRPAGGALPRPSRRDRDGVRGWDHATARRWFLRASMLRPSARSVSSGPGRPSMCCVRAGRTATSGATDALPSVSSLRRARFRGSPERRSQSVRHDTPKARMARAVDLQLSGKVFLITGARAGSAFGHSQNGARVGYKARTDPPMRLW